MPVLVIPTGTVTGQVVDVTGQPADGVLVVATLRAGQTTPQTIAPAGQVVPSEISTFTDASGFWSLSLVPNSNITPANTTYVISVPGMPDVQISLTDTASHPYLSLAVSPIGATLVTAGQTITGPLTISGGITGPNPWYDVKAYGAKGDGVTDDTAAIQLALDTAGASVGGVVWAPPGTYITSARLIVPFSVEFRGAGRNSTTLKAANTFPINTEMVRLGD